MSEWNDMESAPLDGTQVVLFSAKWDECALCRWETADALAADEDGDPEDYNPGWYSEDGDEFVTPSHWMPVPKQKAPTPTTGK